MSRNDALPAAALEQSRAFSSSIHGFAHDRRGSSPVTVSACAAIIAAAALMTAPSIAPMVEQNVFASLNKVEDREPVRIAVAPPSERSIVPNVPRADGSPISTGSLKPSETRAAREAARVIDAMDEAPQRRLHALGLRGSLSGSGGE